MRGDGREKAPKSVFQEGLEGLGNEDKGVDTSNVKVKCGNSISCE